MSMFGLSSLFHKFRHVEQEAVHALLPFLENEAENIKRGVAQFVARAIPIGESLVIDLIKNKGQISDADRTAAGTQLKQSLVAAAVDTGVQVTTGLATWILDTAYHGLKFKGAIVPSDNQVNIGIAATKVDSSTAVIGPVKSASAK